MSSREISTREKERWWTRKRDGRFDRYLPGPGTYHVRVRREGGAAAERTVEVAEGQRIVLEIGLERKTGR